MSSGNPDCDHCDRIKETDDKYSGMVSKVEKQGCSKENNA